MNERGQVYLVGAGPGGKGLLTLRGAQLLSSAEVVLHEPGLDPELLQLATSAAELIGVASHAPAAKRQLLVEKAKSGRRVVSLLPGDPRSDPEALVDLKAVQAAGLGCELVPGVAAAAQTSTPTETQARPTEGPLAGQRIVVTRSRDQAEPFATDLREQGATVLHVPVIKMAPPDDKQSLADALLGLHEYDWLVFTSVNGVNAFFDYFFKAFQDLRDLGGVHIAAVGPVTAARLRELHLMVDAMPGEALGKHVARAMAEHGSIENLRVCLFRAAGANRELPQNLEENGAIVDDVACYQTVAETEDQDGTACRLAEGGAEWVTFTSGSTVKHFHARFNLPELLRKFPAMRTASIGPETSKALAELSLKPDVEAPVHTTEGLTKAITRARSRAEPRSAGA
jgi:uroporphyrinogen-III synthase